MADSAIKRYRAERSVPSRAREHTFPGRGGLGSGKTLCRLGNHNDFLSRVGDECQPLWSLCSSVNLLSCSVRTPQSPFSTRLGIKTSETRPFLRNIYSNYIINISPFLIYRKTCGQNLTRCTFKGMFPNLKEFKRFKIYTISDFHCR